MLIENWMTKDVITITPDRSMMKASKVMKDKNISRIPVVDDNGKLIGIVSDRDIKDASPSKATTLDMHELYYLLSEIKIQDIMTKKVKSIKETETVEKAAVLMLEGNFGGLPVLDEEEKVVGIITDTDIFKVLVEISGVYEGGTQVCLSIKTASGSLSPVIEFLKNHNARVMSIMTQNVPAEAPIKDIYIRLRDMEKPEFKRLQEAMAKEFDVKYWTIDSVHTVL
ncbi:CBS and ACT domain-containing protein [Pseudodesulfovibrio sediminis]|uniref:Membrane protein n=1 Tax=Pseudodesulfovibrio sediminis TaxID=2810563 RepID=A0ABN6EV01_9BACT|nr:CBS and ACT domain-containing protein [Pseudodesulfovibrio sediminis]BCS88884.1 membrane protein [Pseudodesulfovibrio sediminis]